MISLGDLVQMDGFPQMRGIVVAFGTTEHGDNTVVEVYNAKTDFRHRFLLKDLIKINKNT